MRHSLQLTSLFLTAVVLTTSPVLPVHAEPVVIAITADVALVDDRSSLLDSAVNVGDIITGTYVYESTTLDTNSLPTVGVYQHSTAPFGITLNVGGLEFRTDPANVNFLVEIVNDHGESPSDNYQLISYLNLFDVSAPESAPGRPAENYISWQLDNPTATALSSEALPTVPPTLADWGAFNGLDIVSDSGLYRFLIRAEVAAATLITDCSKKPKELRKRCKE
jgi:hypothetical protein